MLNFVRSGLFSPHIYFVLTKDCLYVGETQQHPVMRWGEHLSTSGSLRSALNAKGDPEINYLDEILFFGFHCSAIETEFSDVQRRRASQAVEYEAHCVLSEQETPFKLISTTSRTLPRRFRQWEKARSIAEDSVAAFRYALNRATESKQGLTSDWKKFASLPACVRSPS